MLGLIFLFSLLKEGSKSKLSTKPRKMETEILSQVDQKCVAEESKKMFMMT